MRYIPHSEDDFKVMFDSIGVSDFETLIKDIPSKVRVHQEWENPGLSEKDLLAKYKKISGKNLSFEENASFIGGGVYDHFVPSVVKHMGSKPEFLTSYTQYQPESNQGMLQGLFEYQSMMCRLTDMDVSNASHYDGATSLAEAALMAYRNKVGKIYYSPNINPYHLEVLKSYFSHLPETLVSLSQEGGQTQVPSNSEDLVDVSAVIVSYPNFYGSIESFTSLLSWSKDSGAVFIMSVNPLSLGILESPGNIGADIVVGEGQSLGLDAQFGGPFFGFMCVRSKWMRKMPGRIVGETVDKEGRVGYVLTLQTREQHIRRERAVSNICTNQALCALRSGVYLAHLGDQGLRTTASESCEKAHLLFDEISKLPGVSSTSDLAFFNEFCLELNHDLLNVLVSKLKAENILGGIIFQSQTPQKAKLLVAVTEKRTIAEINKYIEIAKEVLI